MLVQLSTVLAFATAGSALTMRHSHHHMHTHSKREVGTTFQKRGTVSITPHDAYSSSIGVLGCKITPNRAAYWPDSPDCNNICVRVEANGRHVYLLKVDQSGGAHDISYGAWNHLLTGHSAIKDPQVGGGFDATYEYVHGDECKHLLNEPQGKLAFSAANSMNFLASCGPDTWVGQNFALYNIANTACTLGKDEQCQYPDVAAGYNQPTCPSMLGNQDPLEGCAVENIEYQSGTVVKATQ